MLPLTFLPWVCQIFAWQAPWAHQPHLLIVWSFQYWRHKLLPQEYQDQNTTLEPTCIIKKKWSKLLEKRKIQANYAGYVAWNLKQHIVENTLWKLLGNYVNKWPKRKPISHSSQVPTKVCTVYVWTINPLSPTRFTYKFSRLISIHFFTNSWENLV